MCDNLWPGWDKRVKEVEKDLKVDLKIDNISKYTIMFGISIITCAMFYDSMCYVLRSHVLCSMITQAMSFNHACTMSYNYT